jgi:hypothetical protein
VVISFASLPTGMDGVFVGSGIFKSGNPAERAKAMVLAVTHYKDAKLLAEVGYAAERCHYTLRYSNGNATCSPTLKHGNLRSLFGFQYNCAVTTPNR